MITIKNTQQKIRINTKDIKKDAQTLLYTLGYSDFDLGIWFTTNETIRKYNKTYRKKDKPTDILSFSYHSKLKPGQKIKVLTEEDKNLGDLIISLEFVKDNLTPSTTLQKRLRILLVHGICHLLGYDHETDSDYKIMHCKELSLLKKLK